MDHFRAGSRATKYGPATAFTGTVFTDPIIDAPAPARVRALRVTFLPGARTFWHTHPLGQTLYVLSGVGRFGTWGEGVVEIRPGDTVWIPPGEKHWHGASPGNEMTHIAFQEYLDGTAVPIWRDTLWYFGNPATFHPHRSTTKAVHKHDRSGTEGAD